MKVLAAPHSLEEEIKKSRFIAHARRLTSTDAFEDFLMEVHEPKANHHCWAWLVDGRYRSSDDGEPSGTAGRPILAAIEHAELAQTAVIVVRYFGGIKLGAGGLVRAYGGTAAKCLQQARTRTIVPRQTLVISAPFALTGVVHHAITQYNGEVGEESHSSAGTTWHVSLPANQVDAIRHHLKDAGSGDISAKPEKPADD